MWNSLVRNELGQMKVVQVRPSHVRLFYSRLSKQKYSHSTIKFLHNMILPSFEVAVDDDIMLIDILFDDPLVKLNSAIIDYNHCQWQGLRRHKCPIDNDFVYEAKQSSRA